MWPSLNANTGWSESGNMAASAKSQLTELEGELKGVIENIGSWQERLQMLLDDFTDGVQEVIDEMEDWAGSWEESDEDWAEETDDEAA